MTHVSSASGPVRANARGTSSCAHGDELLHHYALLPWAKLFEAQRRLGEQLASVLEGGGPDPWAKRPRCYLGITKVKRILELRGQGVPSKEIAKRLRISVPTIYRIAPAKRPGAD
jgi:hypothetical protein